MKMLSLLVVLPLIGAFLIPAIARISVSIAKFIGPLILLYLLSITMPAFMELQSGQSSAIHFAGFLPPYGIAFYIDELSLLFANIILIAFLMVWPWNKNNFSDNHSEIREYSLYLLLLAASSGLVLSSDLFNLYVFYELLAVASYGLIAKQPKIEGIASAASFRYLLLSASGSVLLLLGIALIYSLTGTLNIAHLSSVANESLNTFAGVAAFLLILIGIGVKAEMFPVNSWVPEVYGVISRPLSALFAGLISKIAVLFIAKVLLMVYQQDSILTMILFIGVLGVLTGELIAYRARDMVRMLSFSSIAQLGLVFTALAIPGKTGLYIAVAFMLHHLVVKSALFFLSEKMHSNHEHLKGLYHQSPFIVILFIFLILSLLGIPPFPGFWIKLNLVLNLSTITYGNVAIAIVLLATVIEAAYLFTLVKKMLANDESNKQIAYQTGYQSSYLFAVLLAIILLVSTFNISSLSKSIENMANNTN
ncbi:MAG: NADH-quinone oxidoreductase subunit J [Gammaproteobacteria bacterium]|nr:NADH-quinone oxidoreductase subunit J [Gammaproteobacteria bacterium]